VGFTWYSLTDQIDWDTALRENNGRVNPLGLCDLDRQIRPVGRAYQQLIKEWREILPTQSVCLRVPLYYPSQQEQVLALESRLHGSPPPVRKRSTAGGGQRRSDVPGAAQAG
jgi:beta-glucosidase